MSRLLWPHLTHRPHIAFPCLALPCSAPTWFVSYQDATTTRSVPSRPAPPSPMPLPHYPASITVVPDSDQWSLVWSIMFPHHSSLSLLHSSLSFSSFVSFSFLPFSQSLLCFQLYSVISLTLLTFSFHPDQPIFHVLHPIFTSCFSIQLCIHGFVFSLFRLSISLFLPALFLSTLTSLFSISRISSLYSVPASTLVFHDVVLSLLPLFLLLSMFLFLSSLKYFRFPFILFCLCLSTFHLLVSETFFFTSKVLQTLSLTCLSLPLSQLYYAYNSFHTFPQPSVFLFPFLNPQYFKEFVPILVPDTPVTTIVSYHGRFL